MEEQGKWMAIEKLALKYAPEDTADGRKRAINREWRTLCVLEMTVFQMTGKEAIELINAKRVGLLRLEERSQERPPHSFLRGGS